MPITAKNISMKKTDEPFDVRQKRILRAKAVKIIGGGVSQQWDSALQKLLSLEEYKKAETAAGFMPTQSEPQIQPFLKRVLSDGKTLCLPKCADRHGNMDFYKIQSFSQLAPQSFGIYEPCRDTPQVNPQEIDFMLIPCLCCGENGMRLGHGGGYYDRYLKKTNAFCVAVCFDEVLFGNVPGTQYDVKPDAILTQTKLIML